MSIPNRVQAQHFLRLPPLALLLAGGISCRHGDDPAAALEPADPPEVAAGERLFLETRFANFFFLNSRGRANTVLATGDPVLEVTEGVLEDLPGPFRGTSMSCRACHMVDEHGSTPGGGVRTYADFARRSPVPRREDGLTHTARNSPSLVDSAGPRRVDILLHFDGEFASVEDLVRATFLGRNFGWLPAEAPVAAAHLAHIIREDDGKGDLAAQFGGLPYRVLLAGRAPSIPPELRLPREFRLDVRAASDGEILDAVARLVGAYVRSLLFARDTDGAFIGSPFDAFLRKNGLPRKPDPGESEGVYARRLRGLLEGLSIPAWVDADDGAFTLHDQAFAFGPRQLQGLRKFLAEPAALPVSDDEASAGGIGNCVSCHPPPSFTDFRLHNIGASQDEYDGIHGAGAFAALPIPTLSERSAAPDQYFPASPARPGGSGPFLAAPSAGDPSRVDLGLWNVFANDAVPAPQPALRRILGASDPPTDVDLAGTIGRFKTPTLRDLGQSAPYFHTGGKDNLEEVIRHYLAFSALARAGVVRNGDPQLAGIAIVEDDVEALEAFLRSLNEDYQ